MLTLRCLSAIGVEVLSRRLVTGSAVWGRRLACRIDTSGSRQHPMLFKASAWVRSQKGGWIQKEAVRSVSHGHPTSERAVTVIGPSWKNFSAVDLFYLYDESK